MRPSHLAVAGWLLSGLVTASLADEPPAKGQPQGAAKVSAEEIDRIVHEVPTELVRYQQAYADGAAVPLFSQFIQIQVGGDSHGK